MVHLTDLTIRRAKAAHKPYTFKGGDGLYLNINPSGPPSIIAFGRVWTDIALYARRRVGPLGDKIADSFRDTALDRTQAQNGNATFR